MSAFALGMAQQEVVAHRRATTSCMSLRTTRLSPLECSSRPERVVALKPPIHCPRPVWNSNAAAALLSSTAWHTDQSQLNKEVACLR